MILKNSDTDAIINDGIHTLYVAKGDYLKTVEIEAILEQNFDHNKLLVISNKNSNLSINTKDYFIIETKLVATNLTTNSNIQALLCYKKRWKILNYNLVFENLTYVSDSELLRVN